MTTIQTILEEHEGLKAQKWVAETNTGPHWQALMREYQVDRELFLMELERWIKKHHSILVPVHSIEHEVWRMAVNVYNYCRGLK